MASGIKSICFQVYPESGNIKDTLQKLVENGLDGWCSPLHTPDDGKPHYHIVVIRFQKESKGLSYKTWQDIADVCGAANSHFDKCYPHDYAAYLVHDRDKSKQQFQDYQVIQFDKDISFEDNKNNVISFGCTEDYQQYIMVHDCREKTSKETQKNQLVEILRFCKEQGVLSYANLVDWAIDNQMSWFEAIISNSSQITAYMRSMEYTRKMFAESNKRDKFSDSEELGAVLAFDSAQKHKDDDVLVSISGRNIEVLGELHKQGAMC